MTRKNVLFYGLGDTTKKRKLKKWCDYLLIFINIVAFILLSGENNNILHDLIIKIMLLSIILINSIWRKKWQISINIE